LVLQLQQGSDCPPTLGARDQTRSYRDDVPKHGRRVDRGVLTPGQGEVKINTGDQPSRPMKTLMEIPFFPNEKIRVFVGPLPNKKK